MNFTYSLIIQSTKDINLSISLILFLLRLVFQKRNINLSTFCNFTYIVSLEGGFSKIQIS